MTTVTLAELNALIAASPAQGIVKAELTQAESVTGGHFEPVQDWALPCYEWRRLSCPEALQGRAGRIPVYHHCTKTGIVRTQTAGEFYGNDIKAAEVKGWNVVITETITRVTRVEATSLYMARIIAARSDLTEARKVGHRIDVQKHTDNRARDFAGAPPVYIVKD